MIKDISQGVNQRHQDAIEKTDTLGSVSGSATTSGLYFSVKIGELSEQTFDVVGFELTEALSTLFTLTLTLSSRDADIDLQQQLLQKVRFVVYSSGQKQRTVNGIVESAVRGDSGFKRTYYTVIVRPLLWLLTLTQDSRIYHVKSVPAILDTILQSYNISFDKQLMDSHSVREYTTMKRESYFDFFCRLAAEEGISFWFEEDKLFYSDSRLGMTGGPALIYNPHPQSATKEPVISQLTFGAFMRPTEAKLKDYRYSHPDVRMDAASKANKTLPTFEVYDSYGRYHDEQVAQQFSQYRLDALQSNSESGQASSNSIRLMPGKIFSISEHPSKAMNSRWQIVSITHTGTLPQSLDNESDCSPATLTNQFSFIPGKTDWRPPFMHKPQADGDEIATVVGPAGEEIYVNEDGAVKVAFHWNRYDMPDENASCWVRVMQNWNGDGFGFLATPRIGQEVIIAYLNGDIDRPVITGTVYNGTNRPPVKLPENKTQTVIKTRTHKGDGFNELRFEDENGQEEIYLHAQRDMRAQVNRQQSVLVGENRVAHIKQDDYTRVEGEIRIETDADYSLSVKQSAHTKVADKLLTDAGNEIHLHSGNKLILDAKSEIVLKVGATFINIRAGSITSSQPIVVNPACPNLGTPASPKQPQLLKEDEPDVIEKVITLLNFSG